MAGNITLPNWVNTPDHGKLVMDITQSTTNGVIKWDSFDVGGSATVNFKGPQVEGGYNTLNYVNAGGSMSQITAQLTPITMVIFLSLTRQAYKSVTVRN